MSNKKIDKVSLDEVAQEWLTEDELSWVKQLSDTNFPPQTLYLGTKQQRIIIRIIRARLHFHVVGSISRRRLAVIITAAATILLPGIDQLLRFLGNWLHSLLGT